MEALHAHVCCGQAAGELWLRDALMVVLGMQTMCHVLLFVLTTMGSFVSCVQQVVTPKGHGKVIPSQDVLSAHGCHGHACLSAITQQTQPGQEIHYHAYTSMAA